MRRKTVRRLLWLLGFGCLWLPVFDDPPLQTGAYLQDVTSTGAVVAMVTPTAEVLVLEVTEAEGGIVQQLADAMPARRHEFRIAGLRPARSYGYVVRDGGGRQRDRGLLRTAPDDDRSPVRFVALGDSGALPWWVWLQRSPLFHLPARWGWLPPHPRVARMAEQVLADAPDFVLHVGDMVYPWGWQGHYRAAFYQPFAAVLRQTPCYGVLGNHDVMDDAGRQMLGNFSLPDNEITGDERMWSVTWGGLRLVAFDACEPITAGHPSVAFLERALAEATEPWVVVTSHFPIRSASRQGDREDLVQFVLPLLRRHAVDLYLCGHDHTYQRFGAEGEPPLVVSGGGGKSLYDLREHPHVRVAEAAYHHCTVEVRGPRLTLRAIGLDGTRIDTLELAKGPPDIAQLRAASPARAARIAALLE